LRSASADPDALADSLIEYVNTGKRPLNTRMSAFLRGTSA
jgi:hypothetical protein